MPIPSACRSFFPGPPLEAGAGAQGRSRAPSGALRGQSWGPAWAPTGAGRGAAGEGAGSHEQWLCTRQAAGPGLRLANNRRIVCGAAPASDLAVKLEAACQQGKLEKAAL